MQTQGNQIKVYKTEIMQVLKCRYKESKQRYKELKYCGS